MALALTIYFLLALSVVVIASAQRFRFHPYGNATAKNGRNYNANVGGRAEYDIRRFKNGGKVVGRAEGSQSFGPVDGQRYKEKPQGEVGVPIEIPMGPK